MVDRMEDDCNMDEGKREETREYPKTKNSPFLKSRELGDRKSMPIFGQKLDEKGEAKINTE